MTVLISSLVYSHTHTHLHTNTHSNRHSAFFAGLIFYWKLCSSLTSWNSTDDIELPKNLLQKRGKGCVCKRVIKSERERERKRGGALLFCINKLNNLRLDKKQPSHKNWIDSNIRLKVKTKWRIVSCNLNILWKLYMLII